MTPEKLAKIRKLADDPRGDPATRAIAQAALKRYAKEYPEETIKAHFDGDPRNAFQDVPQYRDPQVPGMKTSPAYDKFKFMDLGAWKKTMNGNPTYTLARKGTVYKIVLFRHKKSPTWGWMKIDKLNDETEFSGKFSTVGEAHEAAWKMISAI